jgi:hypothetical protein
MFIVYNIYIISIISYQNVVFKTNNNSNNDNNYYYLEEKNVGTMHDKIIYYNEDLCISKMYLLIWTSP